MDGVSREARGQLYAYNSSQLFGGTPKPCSTPLHAERNTYTLTVKGSPRYVCVKAVEWQRQAQPTCDGDEVNAFFCHGRRPNRVS